MSDDDVLKTSKHHGDLRTRIAALLREDLADQLRLAGYDDPQWAADVCDNAAVTLTGCLTQEFRQLDGVWVQRWTTAWERDDK